MDGRPGTLPRRALVGTLLAAALIAAACDPAPAPPNAVGLGTASGGPVAGGSPAAQGADPSPVPTAASTPGAGAGDGAGAGSPVPTATAKPGAPTHPAATPAPTPRSTPRPTPVPAPPGLTACPIFPASNVWNRRVDGLPAAADSNAMIDAIGRGSRLHPDFSAAGGYGIPYNIVGKATPRSTIRFHYASESDRVGYPIPAHPRIEGGSDRHVLMVDTNACRLYELYDAVRTSSGWTAGSGAVWNLRSNALRPNGWTSADAAGLPILPGLVRYDEVARGAILHALRFTAPATCTDHVYPARHDAGSGSCTARPPMGLRVRLKASTDLSRFGTQARILLVALQRYGMILADNGSPWYVTGAPSPHWNDDVLHALGTLTGDDFEVVETSGLVNG